MNKLADLIRRVTRIEPAPLGFGGGARKRPVTMGLVAVVGERWASETADAVRAGADAVIVAGRASDGDVADAAKAAGDRPCGARLSDLTVDRLPKLREAGVDFLVLDVDSPAGALLDEELGFVIHVRGEQSDTQLRTLEASPAEAIAVEPDGNVTTVGGQLALRRVSGLARRPLLVALRPDAGQETLLALREAGAPLVSIETTERGGVDTITRLRGVIDELPEPPKRKRRDEAEIRLPTSAGQAAAAPKDDDEEEEENEGDD